MLKFPRGCVYPIHTGSLNVLLSLIEGCPCLSSMAITAVPFMPTLQVKVVADLNMPKVSSHSPRTQMCHHKSRSVQLEMAQQHKYHSSSLACILTCKCQNHTPLKADRHQMLDAASAGLANLDDCHECKVGEEAGCRLASPSMSRAHAWARNYWALRYSA